MPTKDEVLKVLADENVIVACLAEGTLEQDLISFLLDHSINNQPVLIFRRKNLLEGEVIRTRSAKNFDSNYLGKQFDKKIVILRILDSRKESFKINDISKGNRSKLFRIDDKPIVITAKTHPEIEILLVHSLGKYDDYCRYAQKHSGKQKNPSHYVKSKLGLSNCKDSGFCQDFFKDPAVAVEAIRLYHRKAQREDDEFDLFDLLNPEIKK